MTRIGRVAGICGFVALLSVPLTLFLWDWRFTWVALAKGVFGLAAIGFWLLTNGRRVRETFQGRSVFYGAFTGLSVAVVLFGLGVLNYVCYLHPVELDMTREGLFTLSDQTRSLLGGLSDTVEARAFYSPKEPGFAVAQSFLERYHSASDKFAYEFIDPVSHLGQAEQYKINSNGPRIVLGYQGREERVKLTDPERSSPEEALTAGLLKLVQGGSASRICFTTGHGEKSLDGGDPRQSISLWARDLQGEGYRTEPISLLELAAVPADCEAVVVAGPSRDLVPDEIASLDKYFKAGGKLLALIGSQDSNSLDAWLGGFGVRLGRDTVLFPGGRSPLEVVTDPRRYPQAQPIFARLFSGGRAQLNQLQAVFPLARSVTSLGELGGLQPVELVTSTTNAWAETGPLQGVDEVRFDRGQDQPGPVPLAVAAASRPAAPGAPAAVRRLAVFGSSLFASDMAYRVYPFNRNLAMNTVAWLTHEEKKITIRPRFRTASLLRLDESQLKFITFLTSDILPLVILALGITIWQVRRWS